MLIKSPSFYLEVKEIISPSVPFADDGSLDYSKWLNGTKRILDKSINSGTINSFVDTYSLVRTGVNVQQGGVLAADGSVYFIGSTNIQKISSVGVVSTFNLVYTVASGRGYSGAVLAPNGDIHLVPFDAAVGQKISSLGTISTYSLIHTTNSAYVGGVVDTEGAVHFVPHQAVVGQKISKDGIVSTYTLVAPGAASQAIHYCGILDSNGEINFLPYSADSVGQKVSKDGVVSTYSLPPSSVATGEFGLRWLGGVLDPNGVIHLVPNASNRGCKISPQGVVSTYSLVYTTSNAYIGGVLAPDGDIHFIPASATVGQKVSKDGVVSTYSLVYTTSNAYSGGILDTNGDIHFVPYSAVVGQKIVTRTFIPWPTSLYLHPHFNKY